MENNELENEINILEKQKTNIKKPEDVNRLLIEARALLKRAFHTEFEEKARNLFREIRALQERQEEITSQEEPIPKKEVENVSKESTHPDYDNSNHAPLAEARRLFYAGEYLDAIKIYEDIIKIDPGNREAKERRATAEYNIKHGIVPDTKVPYLARTAYGRAQSLESAGKYYEAKETYTEALEIAEKVVGKWKPAIEALLRIEQEIYALNTRDEADKLTQADKWEEAIEKYKLVVTTYTFNDNKAESMIKILSRLLESYRETKRKLELKSESLLDQSSSAVQTMSYIKILHSELPNSVRLAQMQEDIDVLMNDIRDTLFSQAKNLLEKAKNVYSITIRKQIYEEASTLLGHAEQVDPNNIEIPELNIIARSEIIRLNQVQKDLFAGKKTIEQQSSADQTQEYAQYQLKLEELLLEAPKDEELLARFEWIRKKRQLLVRELRRDEYFNKQITSMHFQSNAWFFGSVITAFIFVSISVYIILLTVNRDNPLSSLVSLVSLIPILATKLVYDQSTSASKRADEFRKKIESESERDYEIEKVEIDELRNKIFNNSSLENAQIAESKKQP